MLSEVPTDLHDGERTVFRRRILNSGTWTSELELRSGRNLLLLIGVGFMEMKNLISELLEVPLLIICLYHPLWVDLDLIDILTIV